MWASFSSSSRRTQGSGPGKPQEWREPHSVTSELRLFSFGFFFWQWLPQDLEPGATGCPYDLRIVGGLDVQRPAKGKDNGTARVPGTPPKPSSWWACCNSSASDTSAWCKQIQLPGPVRERTFSRFEFLCATVPCGTWIIFFSISRLRLNLFDPTNKPSGNDLQCSSSVVSNHTG